MSDRIRLSRARYFLVVLALLSLEHPGFLFAQVGIGLTQDPKSGKDAQARLACSAYDFFFQSALSITSGDVLIRVTAIWDATTTREGMPPEGLLTQETDWYRCVFDHPSRRLAQYHRFEREGLDFSLKPFSPTLFSGSSSWTANLNTGFLCSQVDGQPPMTNLPIAEDWLNERTWIDARSFGFCPFSSGRDLAKKEAWIAKLSAGEQFLDSTDNGDGTTRLRIMILQRKEGKSRLSVWIDHKIGLPIRFLAEGTVGSNEKWLPELEDNITWTEKNGHQVPSTIQHRHFFSERNSEGRWHHGYRDIQYDFCWFSINEQPAAEFFDGSRIGGAENQLRWTDPIANGADNLSPGSLDSGSKRPSDVKN